MSMKGYTDVQTLMRDARRYASEPETAKGAKKYIFLLCKALERTADKLGNNTIPYSMAVGVMQELARTGGKIEPIKR